MSNYGTSKQLKNKYNKQKGGRRGRGRERGEGATRKGEETREYDREGKKRKKERR